MQAQQGHQGLQFLAALNRFQRLIVLRQHIRESILAFDEVADEFETHPDLYDTQTALHITNMRLNLHNLCQRITQVIAAQQTELETYVCPDVVVKPTQPSGCKWQLVVDFPLGGLKKV